MGWQLLLLQLVMVWLTAVLAWASDTKPGCQETCGNVRIPYPFGIGHGCGIDEKWFNLTCNDASDPPKPFWGRLEILNISLEGEMSVKSAFSIDCYEKSFRTKSEYSWINLFDDAPFTFSNTRNRFTAIGCDTAAYVTGSWPREYTSGCVSRCSKIESVENKSCDGIGCCQTTIPAGVKRIRLNLTSFNNHTSVMDFNPCSYAFLIDQDHFKFSISDLSSNSPYNILERVPVVLDWAIGNETCKSARRNVRSFACVSENSNCSDSSGGYRCSCSNGYRGNPYLKGGCKDIDECRENLHKCKGKCLNTMGNYTCYCPHGTFGDGIEACTTDHDKSNSMLFKVSLAICVSLLFVLIAVLIGFWGHEKRKEKLRARFFKKNGGLFLQRQITKHEGVAAATKIFSEEELERATNDYDETRILGEGRYGTVYKGVLSDNRPLAIKKSKIVDGIQMENFINEVLILSQINHINVVKLLGCCLETKDPLLVYEFISKGTLSQHIHGIDQSNGTLSQHIHDIDQSSLTSLKVCLRIALETAKALDYLHSAVNTPIFHGDVKSKNILLDNNLTAKVSDFGASRLVPLNQAQILEEGALGYLDPEYLCTFQLAKKSDVYSFGVVLVELLTGEKPVSSTRPKEETSLHMYFNSLMKDKENRLLPVLKNRFANEGGKELLLEVAGLAERCLILEGEKRPPMSVVVTDLDRCTRFMKDRYFQRNHVETRSLSGEPLEGYKGNSSVVGPDNCSISTLEIGW